MYFSDDSIWEAEEQEFSQLSLFDNGIYDGINGSGYYSDYSSNRTYRDDVKDVWSFESKIVLFRFQDDTAIVKSGDFSSGYIISNSGSKKLSTIYIGNDTQPCEYIFTEIKTEEYETDELI